MRILFVTPYFYPAQAFGGPVKVAFDVGRKLVKRGHEVVVFSSDAKDLDSRLHVESDEIEGMKVYYFRNSLMFFVKRSKLFITPELSRKIKSNIRSFDIVHMHEYRTYQNIVVHRFAEKFAVPYVLQAHGSLPRIGRPARKVIYDFLFGQRILRDASKVIALSQAEAQQYRGMGVPEENIEVIPNGIDLSEYSDLPPKGCFKKKFGIDDDEKIVLYLGRIHRIKGIDILVRAFANVVKKLDDVRLVVVGPDDGYLGELEALIKALKIEDDALILGPLYGRDKLEAYVDADIYVLPSRYETFPMSVLEAYACGKPVVASRVGGLKNLVIDGVKGLLVEPEDVKQLADFVFSLLNDDNRARGMSLRGEQFVKENFGIENVVDKLEGLYKGIISGPTCEGYKNKSNT